MLRRLIQVPCHPWQEIWSVNSKRKVTVWNFKIFFTSFLQNHKKESWIGALHNWNQFIISFFAAVNHTSGFFQGAMASLAPLLPTGLINGHLQWIIHDVDKSPLSVFIGLHCKNQIYLIYTATYKKCELRFLISKYLSMNYQVNYKKMHVCQLFFIAFSSVFLIFVGDSSSLQSLAPVLLIQNFLKVCEAEMRIPRGQLISLH